MFIVRVQSGGERPGPAVQHDFETKRAALSFIAKLGKLALIRKVAPRAYSVRVSPKR